MNVTILPKTKLGRYSIGLTVVFIVLVIGISIVAEIQGLPDNSNGSFFDHGLLAFMTTVAFSATVISLIIGLMTISKNRERSVLVFISILVNIFAVYFAIAEIVGEITRTNY